MLADLRNYSRCRDGLSMTAKPVIRASASVHEERAGLCIYAEDVR